MIQQIQIVIAVIILLTTNSCSGYFAYQRGQNQLHKVQLDMTQAANEELARLKKNEEKRIEIINQSQVQHDKDQAIINLLADKLKRLQIRGICGNSMQPGTGTTTSQNSGAWTFSETVDTNFTRLQQRTSELFRKCDQINIDSIRLNNQIIGIAQLK